MQAAHALLENPDEPVSELTYYRCIDATTENIKVQIWHRFCLQTAYIFTYIDYDHIQKNTSPTYLYTPRSSQMF